jgi:lipoate-protein ligase A
MHVDPRSGAENMARDAGLMDRARETGEAVFSVYAWSRPTLSLGRNQLAAGRYDLREAAARGIDIVRRPTGGRALLHWREVTYSVTAPVTDSELLKDSYERINRILLNGLSRLGVMALEAVGVSPTPRPGEPPCFAQPSDGELVVNGAKLVGSAQYRDNGAMLQHGSILIADDQQVIASLLLSNAPELEPPSASTLSQALGREPAIEEVAMCLFDAVRELEHSDAGILEEAETRSYTARHLDHYRNELWTWRKCVHTFVAFSRLSRHSDGKVKGFL